MFNEFVKIITESQFNPINSIDDSKKYIEKINGTNFENNNINKIENEKIRIIIQDFIKYEKSPISINKIRNKIVHKYGYRPSLKEVEDQMLCAYKFLSGLPCLLHLNNVDYPEL